MKLEQIIKGLEPVAVNGSRDKDIAGITCDSRQVRDNYLFVAITGNKQEGNIFIDDAINRGAIAIITEHDLRLRKEVCSIRVKDTRQSIARVAATFHGNPASKLKVVGITGTNGKTTISFMVRDILRAAGLTPGLIGTIEYEIGERVIPATRTTPDAPALQSMLAEMAGSGCRSAVMEVSSHSLVQHRVADIDFDLGVFTNLTQDHLDYHKSMENYFDAKSILFQSLGSRQKKATAIINIEDAYAKRMAALVAGRAALLYYGFDPDAHVRAENLSVGAGGSAFRAVTPFGSADFNIKLAGRYNVSNALAAIAVAGSLGVSLELMRDALSKIAFVPGRLEEVPTGRGFKVFVDYAHTDDAISKVLSAMREITAGRLIMVFGCGGNRDKAKRPKMGAVASELADHIILTSDNPRNEEPLAIIRQIEAGCVRKNYEVVENRENAIKLVIQQACEGDIIIIAGKGHENFQEYDSTSIPFDDRSVVRRLLKQ